MGSEDFKDNEIYSSVDDQLLTQRHDDYSDLRKSVVEKWCEKTRIGSMPKKGYAALELPTWQLVTNALRDKDRLLRRTQLDRSSHVDNDTHPETFNDDDFYHHLLNEVISKEDTRKWADLQRLRYKNKRKADSKASKGRKVKKDLIPKLVNFMAPVRPLDERDKEQLSEGQRKQMINSLFGGCLTQA